MKLKTNSNSPPFDVALTEQDFLEWLQISNGQVIAEFKMPDASKHKIKEPRHSATHHSNFLGNVE